MVRQRLDGLVTGRELAAIFGVHLVTLHAWERAGMPVAIHGTEGRSGRTRRSSADDFALVSESPAGVDSFRGSTFTGDVVMSRRDVAAAINLHPDSVTRALRDGLGSAVLECGGHGKLMTFSLALVSRWFLATRCGRQQCDECDRVLEDSKAVAEHLLAEGHGYAGCSDCLATWNICLPCDCY